MNDPNNKYPELKLVHSEGNYNLNFFYGDFRGPIRIWKVNIGENILVKEEFLRRSCGYAEFDNLTFTK